MNEERELARHNNIIEQIKNAKSKEDLPNIGLSSIVEYLSTNVQYNKNKIVRFEYKPVVDELFKYGSFEHPSVKKAFVQVLLDNYEGITNEEIEKIYNKINNTKRIPYLIQELGMKFEKIDYFARWDNYDAHKAIMKEINLAYDLKELPKVGLSELNKKLLRAINSNDYNNKFKSSDIKDITLAFINKSDFSYIKELVIKLCEKESLSPDDKTKMVEEILGAFIDDETIDYTVEEMNAKEIRKAFIYKNDHDITMDNIKNAHRISQLPPNLTVSTLSGYLNGNTTIYSNDDRIKAEDLKHLTSLLLDGYKWNDSVIVNEIENIVIKCYPDKKDAFELLFKKLSSLPKTYYLVDEINYSLSRQTEFVGRNSSNVNVYFIPNPKSPAEGGRFYNCYINRVDNLDLTKILPIDLNEIVPPEMDIDAVEWYVQENYDDTFKTAGAIILQRDETIGNVSIFKPNDGKIGVSPEEKEKMDKLDDLDQQIAEKEAKIKALEEDIKNKEEYSANIEARLVGAVNDYEQKALLLNEELVKKIVDIKTSIGLPVNGKGLK
ncbi:MAG: hypothetical protein IKP76_04360 [Bacilli bacterium]|nr:hypothetical protein [Bacilli bacterium]